MPAQPGQPVVPVAGRADVVRRPGQARARVGGEHPLDVGHQAAAGGGVPVRRGLAVLSAGAAARRARGVARLGRHHLAPTATSSPTTTWSRPRSWAGASPIRSTCSSTTSASSAPRSSARDPQTDVALLNIDAKGADGGGARRLGQARGRRVGRGHRQARRPASTVTAGIVSAKGRRGDQLGGGLNRGYWTSSRPTRRSTPATRAGRWSTCAARSSASTPRSTRDAQGLGFAMPINMAKRDGRRLQEVRQGAARLARHPADRSGARRHRVAVGRAGRHGGAGHRRRRARASRAAT